MIRLFIAEDQRMLLSALGSLLDLEEDMEVIGQATNGEEALTAILKLEPDVCLMDIEMPVKSGLEVAEELAKQGAKTKIIILTTFARPGYFERAVKSNVHGYLLKDGKSTISQTPSENARKAKEPLVRNLPSTLSAKQTRSPNANRTSCDWHISERRQKKFLRSFSCRQGPSGIIFLRLCRSWMRKTGWKRQGLRRGKDGFEWGLEISSHHGTMVF